MLESLTKSTGIAVRVGALGLALAGCATAELAIDLVKKTQKEQETVKQAEGSRQARLSPTRATRSVILTMSVVSGITRNAT